MAFSFLRHDPRKISSLFSLFTKEHDGYVVSASEGHHWTTTLEDIACFWLAPLAWKAMVAVGGHGCIVSSMPEPRH